MYFINILILLIIFVCNNMLNESRKLKIIGFRKRQILENLNVS